MRAPFLPCLILVLATPLIVCADANVRVEQNKDGGLSIFRPDVKTPIFLIALKDDHVSAWSAVYDGGKLFGGPVTFVMGGSGHNAGVINPPAANKHGFWTGDARPEDAQDWLDGATRNEGSWWPFWADWLAAHGSGKSVPARTPADPIEPAPGSYISIAH